MITEDYVSFKMAKLLKEKGFDGFCNRYYQTDKEDVNGEYAMFMFASDLKSFCTVTNSLLNKYADKNHEIISAPTLQIAMKWLREMHNILLVVDYEYECDTTPYFFKIYRLGENGKPERVAIKGVSYGKNDNAAEHIVGYRDWERSKSDYSTYEEAAEAAIKYCIENLI